MQELKHAIGWAVTEINDVLLLPLPLSVPISREVTMAMWPLSRVVILVFAISRSVHVSSFTSLNGISFSKAVRTPSFTEIHRMSKWNEEDDTFIRDTPEQVRRKKKGSKEYKSYKSHDNSDALPFLVKVKTPDPYTKDEEMLKQARKNSAKTGNKKAARTRNVFGVASNANAIAASVYARRKNGELHQVRKRRCISDVHRIILSNFIKRFSVSFNLRRIQIVAILFRLGTESLRS